MFKKSFASILIILFALSSSSAFAFKWGAKTKITGYFVYSGGGAFINVESKENPDNCTNGSTYLALDSSAPGFNALYSTIIAAYASNQTVTLNYDGCFNGYPKVNSVAVPGIW